MTQVKGEEVWTVGTLHGPVCTCIHVHVPVTLRPSWESARIRAKQRQQQPPLLNHSLVMQIINLDQKYGRIKWEWQKEAAPLDQSFDLRRIPDGY